MKYDVEYYLEKFTHIPEDQWCIGSFHYKEKHCALGFCGVVRNKFTREGHSLLKILKDVIEINDGDGLNDRDGEYAKLGDTPKERIINALTLVHAGIL